MQVYRDGGLSLDQLMAFAITEDHDRQEQVFDNLSWNREPATIRRDLGQANVEATERRARFVGADAYAEQAARSSATSSPRIGAAISRMPLLDRLVIGKLEDIAAEVRRREVERRSHRLSPCPRLAPQLSASGGFVGR
jgi:ParB family chromosome partitioning protein